MDRARSFGLVAIVLAGSFEGFLSLDLACRTSLLGDLDDAFRSMDLALARLRSKLGEGVEDFRSMDLARANFSKLFCRTGVFEMDRRVGTCLTAFRSASAAVEMLSLLGSLESECFFGGLTAEPAFLLPLVDSILASLLGGCFRKGLLGRMAGELPSDSSALPLIRPSMLLFLGACFFGVALLVLASLLDSSLLLRSRRPWPGCLVRLFFSLLRPRLRFLVGFRSTATAAPADDVRGGCFLGITFLAIPSGGEGATLSIVSPDGLLYLLYPSPFFGTHSNSRVLFMAAYNLLVGSSPLFDSSTSARHVLLLMDDRRCSFGVVFSLSSKRMMLYVGREKQPRLK